MRCRVEPHPDPTGRTQGFWDVGTATHVDWSCQSRTIEIAERSDGTLSIFCTMIDHDAPAAPASANGLLRLASIHREPSANDYQYGFDGPGRGAASDRNVELPIRKPF